MSSERARGRSEEFADKSRAAAFPPARWAAGRPGIRSDPLWRRPDRLPPLPQKKKTRLALRGRGISEGETRATDSGEGLKMIPSDFYFDTLLVGESRHII